MVCPVCKEELATPDPADPQTQDSLIFIGSEYIPYQVKPEAHAVIKTAFVKGAGYVRAHVTCCFDLSPAAKPAVTGPVVLRLVSKKSSA